MLLKSLINPKPSIILFFIVFCVLFANIPLIKFDIRNVFFPSYLNSFIVLFLGILLPFLLSVGLNNIVYEKNIIRKENLVIGFVFMLISSFFINNPKVWISSFLLLFMFNFLIDSYQKALPFSQFYNAAIMLGCLTFVYPNLILLTLLLIISGINYSNLNWRIIITIFLGVFTPYFFYFMFVFVTERTLYIPQFLDFSVPDLSIIANYHISKKIWIVLFVIITLLSFYELFAWLYKKSIKSRRSFMTIIWFFIITSLISVYSNWEYMYFSLFPLSIIIGNYFVYTKNKRIASVLFLLLIISSIHYKYLIGFNV